MIELAHPHVMWLLALLPLVAVLRWWWSERARRANASTGAYVESLRRRSSGREALRAVLLWSGLASAIVALAGPRWGEAEQTRQASGADLLIAFDCSRSMLATDLFPDRLRLARRKAMDLLDHAPEMRVALLPFAATAVLRCPLTGDHLAVATLLEDCDPELFPAEAGLQGTAIGSAVRTGLDLLARESGAGQAILVISDGADPDQDAVKAATDAAKERGIPVYGLFIGDPERSVTVQIDGRPVTMAAQRGSLDALANATGAITVNATVNDDDVTTLAAHLGDHLARRPWQERSRVVASEHYQLPLAIALVLLACGWLMPTSRRSILAVLVLGMFFAPAGLSASEPWRELAPITAQASHDPAGAKAALEQLLVQHPDSAATHYNLGCLQLGSDPANAARHLEAATHSSQNELAADAWHNLALTRLKLGQLDEALAAADQALSRRPEVADFTRTSDELRRAVVARDDAKRRAAEEAAKRLRLATSGLPPAHLGEAYSATLAATGGTVPYRFSAKKLPDGLRLAADGGLSGTPSTKGPQKLDITVNDAAKGGATGTVTLDVLPAPAITTSTLPEAIVTIPYYADIACEGLIAPRWSIDGLPPGLTASIERAGAVISGTPTVQGSSTVRISAQDADHHADRELSLVVGDSFAPAEQQLPPATAFAAYRHRLTVRGRAMTYRWLRPKPENGISIATDGSVSSTPGSASDLTLHATIAAEDGRTRVVELLLPVNPPPVIEEEKRITVTRGQAVNRPLKVSGGTPPYRWSGSGAPTGLRVDPDGSLRGAAAQVGESELTITCEDHWQAGTELKITVVVEERKDPDQEKKEDPKKDEPKKDEQDQNQDQKLDQKQDQKQDQSQQQKPSPDGQQGDKPKPETGDPKQGDKPKNDPGKDESKTGAQSQAQRADGATGEQPKPVSAAEQAADRWIENLPKDDRDALRMQLLQGAPAPVRSGENPW